MANNELVDAVRASADRLGINPSDLLTAMSYETGGKLDPNLWGGKNNNYLGLIQFGPEERAKYGVKPGMAVTDQVTAAENFLRDRGIKPGMGMLDVYSTINAGSPGRYTASDANNGGSPGTVADKVANQMIGHRARANALLGGADQLAPQQTASAAPATPTAAMTPSATPVTAPGDATTDDATAQTLAALQKIPATIAQDQGIQPIAPPQTINFPVPVNVAKARALARAMAARQIG